jgi:ABC-type Zn uptake system ZnuABC Zn-binding protein ZnuA
LEHTVRIPSDVCCQPGAIVRGLGTGLATLLVVALSAPVAAGQGPVSVVATTEDLASLTREIGGEAVSVEAIARGYQDPHFVEPKPSFILRLVKADLLIVVGRDLEAAWLPPLLQQSRNARIQSGARGYLDASLTAQILDVPTGPVTRAMGDVHALGNPHYWLDPGNGRHVAREIMRALTTLQPSRAAYFSQRYADFDRRLADAERRWDAMVAPYRGTKVVTYHRSWSNFAQRFGLDVIGYVEPRPGIPPSASHTRNLVQEMRGQGVRLIIVEPYFDRRTPNAIARDAGARVLELSPSVGGMGADSYISLFDANLSLLIDAVRQTASQPRSPEHHDEHGAAHK